MNNEQIYIIMKLFKIQIGIVQNPNKIKEYSDQIWLNLD